MEEKIWNKTRFNKIFSILEAAPQLKHAPAIHFMKTAGRTPFRILIATILSLRTKDETTASASERLFAIADTPEAIAALPKETIEKLIYPVGFYKTKAGNIKKICEILIRDFNSQVPANLDTLLELPGVVLAISPFNYPVNLLISKLAPALIAGNTVVYKSATQGSLVGARISELFYEANFPKGVVNCVTGVGRDIGDLLVTNPNISMISFTGSTNVGQRIAEITSKIPLVLELGGKDPAIVLDDADVELAANEIVKGGLSYNGQRCTAIKRVLVTPAVHETLTNQIVSHPSAARQREASFPCYRSTCMC